MKIFFGLGKTKGKLNVDLGVVITGRELFLCCSSTAFIIVSETHCHVCPPKRCSLSPTTLVPTAESVHCQGGKGIEMVGQQ